MKTLNWRLILVAVTAILALALPLRVSAAPAAGAFTHANGYFYLAGDQGLITDLRLDATGAGGYGANTLAATGHFGWRIDGGLMTAPAAQWEKAGNILTITGLPGGATLRVDLNGNTLTETVSFSGSHTTRHEWETLFLNNGFYQRDSGQNFAPDQTVDLPFESFYNVKNGNFRPLEMFKRTAGMNDNGNPRIVQWPSTYCRGRKANDVKITATHDMDPFEPEASLLRLVHEGTASATSQITLTVLPKSYKVTLDGDRPMPEFYVKPAQTISSLHDSALTHDTGQLLSEFYHHMSYWWGTQGSSGGIWSDWGMMSAAFGDTPLREFVRGTISGWQIGDDGYGHDGYAYTWGVDRGWPFPSGRDTRHFNTNAIFITSLWRYLMWTGDVDFLTQGGYDRTIRMVYSGNTVTTPPNQTAPILNAGQTFGQSFTATAPLLGIAALTATYGPKPDSGCTLTLYDRPGGTVKATKAFTAVADNSYLTLSGLNLPAGTYYLEMSAPQGTIAWWGNREDAYPGGEGFINRLAPGSILARARRLMQYQQEVLLGGAQNQIVMGNNIGTTDHYGRHQDVGSNYYDILPFGYHDPLTDTNYYQSLRGMADIEMLIDNPTSATYFAQRLPLARARFNQTYWRSGLDRLGQASRYIGGVDFNGVDHDFGYTFINTMAIAAGLAEDHPERVTAVFDWMDHGESQHSPHRPAMRLRIGYAGGDLVTDPAADVPHVPVPLNSELKQPFFADRPFTSVASNNPTWATTTSGFTLSLLDAATGRVIASQTFSNVVDNAYNTLTFPQQPEGHYILRMSGRVGTVGWWAGQWAKNIYGRWVFAPRVSTINNETWWQAAVGGNPASSSFQYLWDVQLQNGGADLYESGFDIWARATAFDADSAWERLHWILRRYADPDRLSGNQGFYGEGIQGGSLGAGSVGWVWSEFPETGILGAAFFNGFFGVDPSPAGLRIRPAIPSGHGITALGARNISYQGALFDLEISANAVIVTCTRNPQGTPFYMTGGLSATGTFTQTVPLVNGQMMLSLEPQPVIPQSKAAATWQLY